MDNIRLEAESIQLSVYCNIICQTLSKHERVSPFKLITFTYLIKQNYWLNKHVYTAKTKNDIVYKGISLLSGEFTKFCDSIPYIVKALHLLILKGMVKLENQELYLISDNLKLNNIYAENNFMYKFIEKSMCMSEKQFLKEVLYSV